MADIQDWYLGQIVTEGEMDQLYTDLNAAERNLAKEAHLGQGPAVTAHRDGGILSGLVVTKDTTTSVEITAGSARDGNGKRISLGVDATVSLTNLGDTGEGETVSATGDGSLTASSITAGEAWLSLFIAYDTNLSDTRIDALNNTINFRQSESFHFELMIGTDAAPPATARANLADTRVLLCDILLDNSGEIRQISGTDAVCVSTYDMNKIGYGPEDTAALAGRRSDWVAIDPDGTSYPLLQTAYDSSEPHTHAYHNIRAGSPREAMQQLIELYAEPGTASKAGGSEVIGGRPVTGKVLSSPGASTALQMPSGSVHTQLEALYDKVNTLLSRGGDTLTGNLILTGSLTVSTITSALSITNTLSVTGKISALTDLDVAGTLKVLASGDLDVDGAADFAEDVQMHKDLTVDQTVNTAFLSIINGGGLIQPDAKSGDTHALNVKPHPLVQLDYDLPSHRQAALWNENSQEVQRWAMYGYMADTSRYRQDFITSTQPSDASHTLVGVSSSIGYGTLGGHGGTARLETGETTSDYAWLRGPSVFQMHHTPTGFKRVLYMRARFRILDAITDMLLECGLNFGTAKVYMRYDPLIGADWDFVSEKTATVTAITGLTASFGTTSNLDGWVDFIMKLDLASDLITFWCTGMSSVNAMNFANPTDSAWGAKLSPPCSCRHEEAAPVV